MKVAVTTPRLSRLAGGLFYSVPALSRSVQENGFDSIVFGGTDQFYRRDIGNWSGLDVAPQTAFGFQSFRIQPFLARNIIKYRPNLIHQHGLWDYHSLVSARLATGGVPRVISPRGMLDSWALRNSGLKKKIALAAYERNAIMRASCVHALCENEYEAIREFGYAGPVSVIPNGVYVSDSLPPKINDSGALRKMIYLGRLHPKKGVEHLVAAFARASIGSDWQLEIAGWGDTEYVQSLERIVQSVDRDSRISLVGPKYGSDKSAFLIGSDAFILPSLSEGLPMAVLEAWSLGVPTLITKECNLSVAFEYGAAVEVSSRPEILEQNLRNFFSLSSDERRLIGDRGYSLAKRSFTWEMAGQDMSDLYRWLLGERACPDHVRFD